MSVIDWILRVLDLPRQERFEAIKEKAKHDENNYKLWLYRDWPPDLVDDYLVFEQDLDRNTLPDGYFAWTDNVVYLDYKDSPQSYDAFTMFPYVAMLRYDRDQIKEIRKIVRQKVYDRELRYSQKLKKERILDNISKTGYAKQLRQTITDLEQELKQL